MKKKNRKLISRVGLIILSLLLIGAGAMTIFLRKDITYSNYWGGLVFAPLVIIIGFFLIYLAVFKWEKFNNKMQ